MMGSDEIRARAREIMAPYWGVTAVIYLVYLALYTGARSLFYVGVWLIIGPLSLGLADVFLRIEKGEPVSVEVLLSGFNDFARSLVAGLLISLYVFLWSLLLIFPGIIAALGYSMTFFIMKENPALSATNAMRASQQMMMGHKARLFEMLFSFIGWILLGIISFGIAFLWVGPYMDAAMVLFYRDLQADNQTYGFVKEAPVYRER
jgi:uncharacterized membrane protein